MFYKPNAEAVLERLRMLYARQAQDRVFAAMGVPSAALAEFRARYQAGYCDYPEPSERVALKARVVRLPGSLTRCVASTEFSAIVALRNSPKGSSPILPTNPDDTPRRARPTATLAGAPPGAPTRGGQLDRLKSLAVDTKSMRSSPMQTAFGMLALTSRPLAGCGRGAA